MTVTGPWLDPIAVRRTNRWAHLTKLHDVGRSIFAAGAPGMRGESGCPGQSSTERSTAVSRIMHCWCKCPGGGAFAPASGNVPCPPCKYSLWLGACGVTGEVSHESFHSNPAARKGAYRQPGGRVGDLRSRAEGAGTKLDKQGVKPGRRRRKSCKRRNICGGATNDGETT